MRGGRTDLGPLGERMTDRARHVVALAEEYAAELGHHYVGTEHLLVGLIRENGGIGAGVLENMGIERAKVETAVEFIVGRKTTEPSEPTT